MLTLDVLAICHQLTDSRGAIRYSLLRRRCYFFSTKLRSLNEILERIEDCSENCGLRINCAKCHSIHMNRDANINFRDTTPLSKPKKPSI